VEAILEKLIESPRLSLFHRQIQQVLEAEQVRRTRFIETMTEGEKVEFINGEVVVHSPVKLQHNNASKSLLVLMSAYVQTHSLGLVGHEKLMISLTRNDYEPDICFFAKQKADTFTAKQMRFPAPDFIAEVLSESTAHNDRGVKFDDYAAHGVTEYWIIDPDGEMVEHYLLDGDAYRLNVKAGSGMLISQAIPGFQIPVRAIFDESENLTALRSLLAE
jgi:Uma2 family endonuclease